LKVFAIDPGNRQSAYCIMDDDYKLREFNKAPNGIVAEILRTFLKGRKDGDRIAVERVASYGMAVGRDVFETCEWIGRFTQIARDDGSYVDYVYRKDEKLNLCHDMRAKDANIRQALINRFAMFDFKNGKGTKAQPDYFYGVSRDCWAAIAVAVTFLDRLEDMGDEEVSQGQGDGKWPTFQD